MTREETTLRLIVDFPYLIEGFNPSIPLRQDADRAARTVWDSAHPRPVVVAFAVSPEASEDMDRIAVRVSLEGVERANVRALAESGDALGELEPSEVATVAVLPMTGARIAAGGTDVRDVTLRWQAEVDGEWRDLGTQAVRVYTIPRPPAEPWLGTGNVPPVSTPYHLWTEVLDLLCVWARGARYPLDAAGRITWAVHDRGRAGTPGRLVYDDNGRKYGNVAGLDPATNELTLDAFYLSAFLERLNGGEGRGGEVNCFDCAGAVAVLGAALGCPLRKVSFSLPDKGPFTLNPMTILGGRVPRDLEFGDFFNEHVVAWAGMLDANGMVFDASTAFREPEGNDAPSVGRRWGEPGEAGSYRVLLTPNEANLHLNREYRPLLLVPPRIAFELDEI